MQKEEMHQVHRTARGNLFNYPVPVITLTAEMTTTKLLLNIVVSTSGESIITCDIKYFYLNTLMLWYKYMRITIEIITQEIINTYNLLPLVNNEHVLFKIRKEIYGLP